MATQRPGIESGAEVAVADRGQRDDGPPHAVDPVGVLFDEAEERPAEDDRGDQQVQAGPSGKLCDEAQDAVQGERDSNDESADGCSRFESR